MTGNDYSYGHEYRARLAELSDIAAMDRLAAQVAPARSLERYAAQQRRAAAGGPGWWQRLLHHGRPARRVAP